MKSGGDAALLSYFSTVAQVIEHNAPRLRCKLLVHYLAQ